MIDLARQTRRYLLPPEPTFWRWQDGGASIGLPGGTTLVFREEIEAAVRRLAPRGLPPLGAIVLVLASAREGWPRLAPRVASAIADAAAAGRRPWPEFTPEVLASLLELHEAIGSLARRPSLPAEVCGVVFENAAVKFEKRLAAEAARILRDPHALANVVAAAPLRGAPRRLDVELHAVHTALREFRFATLRQRLETGLDCEVLPAPIPEIEAEAIRMLLHSLKADAELTGFARLALELVAAAALPRRPIDIDALSAGGASDIDNRGTFDRLLVSELAHDDFTLAVRVAANEALYLRREAPPRSPQSRRAILVDAGVRMWGLPRVFAAAVAAAIAATAARGRPAALFTPKGAAVERATLAKAEDVRALLAVLNPEHHPGRSLPAFVAEARQLDAAELVIVTGEDVLADADFRRQLAPLAESTLFVATVNRDGRFQLLRVTSLGVQKLGGANFSLDALLARGGDDHRPVEALEDPRAREELPMIFRVRPFPLRFLHETEPARTWQLREGGVLSATRDRRLLLWDSPEHGAWQLSDCLPGGDVLWTELQAPLGVASAVVGELSRSKLHLVRASVREGWCESHPLPFRTGEMRGVCEHRGVLFAIYDDRIEGASLEGLRPLPRIERPPDRQWLNQRYFRDEGRLYALSHDGGRPIWEEVPANESVTIEASAAHEDLGGDGTLIVSSGASHGSPIPPGALQSFSATIAPVSVLTSAPAESMHAASVNPPQRIPRLTDIYVDGSDLGFLDESLQLWVLVTGTKGGLFFQAESDGKIPGHGKLRRSFKPWRGRAEFGFSLTVAAWDSGGRAYYDSRGLLHLHSSDSRAPEITFVLAKDVLAGWHDCGGVFGHAYFSGTTTKRAPIGNAFVIVREFVARLR